MPAAGPGIDSDIVRSTIAPMQIRAFRSSDIIALAALQPRYSAEWLMGQLTDPGRDHGHNVLIVDDGPSVEGRVRACAGFVPAGPHTYIAPSIVADHDAGVALFEALIAGHHGRGQTGFVRVSAFDDEAAKATAVQQLGFVRTFAFMTLSRAPTRVALPATPFTRVALTDVAPEDLRRVHNLAFEAVPNSPELSLEEIQHSIDRCLPEASGAWIDAVGNVASSEAWRAGSHNVAGYIWIMRDGSLAEVDAVGVAPGYRGIGLGASMLVHALNVTANEGISELRALIASTNAASLALHRAAGFEELVVMRRGVWQLG